MRRIVVLAIAVGLILGLGYIGFSTQSSAAPPQEPAPEGPVLWKVIENLTLNPGEEFESVWQDATSFRIFKFYACMTPYVGETRPAVKVRVHESPSGGVERVSRYKIAPDDEQWRAAGPPDAEQGWQLMSEFDGLYSNIRVKAMNEEPVGGTAVTISLYLLAAPE